MTANTIISRAVLPYYVWAWILVCFHPSTVACLVSGKTSCLEVEVLPFAPLTIQSPRSSISVGSPWPLDAWKSSFHNNKSIKCNHSRGSFQAISSVWGTNLLALALHRRLFICSVRVGIQQNFEWRPVLLIVWHRTTDENTSYHT